MRAEAPTKPWPIVQSVVDFAPPSKTRGVELIPVSENPCLNIAHSDCFAALCAACAGAQEGDLHRVEGNRAASRRSRGECMISQSLDRRARTTCSRNFCAHLVVYNVL